MSALSLLDILVEFYKYHKHGKLHEVLIIFLIFVCSKYRPLHNVAPYILVRFDF